MRRDSAERRFGTRGGGLMGLDTSHGCWHGAYSAFTRWREALAIAAGYQIKEPTADERANGYYVPYVDMDWYAFTDKNIMGEWDSPPGDDPLLFLIVHSDCDGVIHPEQGIHLAGRLEHLAPLMDEAGSGHIDSMRATTLRFAAGLRRAHAAGEDVDFH